MHLHIVLFVLLTTLGLLDASQDPQSSSFIGQKRARPSEEFSDTESSSDIADTSTEGGSTIRSTYSGILISGASSPRPNRNARRRVAFADEVISNTTYGISGQEAEVRYFTALFKNKINQADEMRRQGLVLSASRCTFECVNKLLRSSGNMNLYLKQLFKYQPHVFGQKYPEDKNVFEEAHPIQINIVLNSLKIDRNILINFYKEHLRNPLIDFPDELYCAERPNRAIEMIELAEASGNADEIMKCYTLPASLLYFDLDGDTVFTKAVKTMNFTRMKWLFKRTDAVSLLFTANHDEFNVFDLAMELFDEGLDPEYTVFCFLLQVITVAYRYDTVKTLEDITEVILDHCREADSNEILLEALEAELESAKAYATANNVGDIQEDFIEFIESIGEKLTLLVNGDTIF